MVEADKAVEKQAETEAAEKLEKPSLDKLIQENRKRTFKMFAHDRDTTLAEDPNLIRMKIKCKIRDNYSKIGEVPGVLVDKVARQKLLKDLGHATTTAAAKQE